jgi:hypothetical protein
MLPRASEPSFFSQTWRLIKFLVFLDIALESFTNNATRTWLTMQNVMHWILQTMEADFPKQIEVTHPFNATLASDNPHYSNTTFIDNPEYDSDPIIQYPAIMAAVFTFLFVALTRTRPTYELMYELIPQFFNSLLKFFTGNYQEDFENFFGDNTEIDYEGMNELFCMDDRDLASPYAYARKKLGKEEEKPSTCKQVAVTAALMTPCILTMSFTMLGTYGSTGAAYKRVFSDCKYQDPVTYKFVSSAVFPYLGFNMKSAWENSSNAAYLKRKDIDKKAFLKTLGFTGFSLVGSFFTSSFNFSTTMLHYPDFFKNLFSGSRTMPGTYISGASGFGMAVITMFTSSYKTIKNPDPLTLPDVTSPTLSKITCGRISNHWSIYKGWTYAVGFVECGVSNTVGMMASAGITTAKMLHTTVNSPLGLGVGLPAGVLCTMGNLVLSYSFNFEKAMRGTLPRPPKTSTRQTTSTLQAQSSQTKPATSKTGLFNPSLREKLLPTVDRSDDVVVDITSGTAVITPTTPRSGR